MKKNLIIITVVLVITGIGGGFFGGMKYAEYQRTQARGGNRQFAGMANGQGLSRTNSLGGRPITGDVIGKDDKSITVKTQDGGSKIVILSNSTTVSKTSDATVGDITIGEKVGVFGTENSDKSMTAQNIQLNPQFRMGGAQPTPTK